MVDRDDELVVCAVRGDQEALGTLLQCHGPQVRSRLAGKIGKQWQAALAEDDVMQVTYLEAFLQIGCFTPGGPGSFLAWLTRMAENNLRDAIKELGRAKRPQPCKRVAPPRGEESTIALLEALGITTTTPSRQAARGEAGCLIEVALEQLPPDYATVLRLYDLAGQPVSEVASAMGRSEGAVYMLRARAQDRLRDLLGPGSDFFTHFA
ncbi:MAG: sigma-70 family RNA polymerase sigma factor [Phycisphaerae bacterium]|nr:sigma-70 family RNA polymerase sigma factor [Phycisphaerae bacterium]